MGRSIAVQGWQFKKETTPGTLVAANKKSLGIGLTAGPAVDIALNRPVGLMVPTGPQLVSEKAQADWSGLADYNSILLPLLSMFGTTTATQPDNTLAPTAWSWVWSFTGKSAIVPVTFSVEVGDATRAIKFPYGTFTSLNLAISRTSENTMDGEMMGQAIQTGAALTATPTEIDMQAIAGVHWKAYYATTFAGLSSATAFDALYEAGISFSDVFTEEWTVNRDVAGFKSLVPNKEPTYEWNMTLGADAVAEAWLTTNVRQNKNGYIRLEAVGDTLGGAVSRKLILDMCVSVTDMDKEDDKDGLLALPISFHLAYDKTAAKSMQITLVNEVPDTGV